MGSSPIEPDLGQVRRVRRATRQILGNTRRRRMNGTTPITGRKPPVASAWKRHCPRPREWRQGKKAINVGSRRRWHAVDWVFRDHAIQLAGVHSIPCTRTYTVNDRVQLLLILTNNAIVNSRGIGCLKLGQSIVLLCLLPEIGPTVNAIQVRLLDWSAWFRDQSCSLSCLSSAPETKGNHAISHETSLQGVSFWICYLVTENTKLSNDLIRCLPTHEQTENAKQSNRERQACQRKEVTQQKREKTHISVALSSMTPKAHTLLARDTNWRIEKGQYKRNDELLRTPSKEFASFAPCILCSFAKPQTWNGCRCAPTCVEESIISSFPIGLGDCRHCFLPLSSYRTKALQ